VRARRSKLASHDTRTFRGSLTRARLAGHAPAHTPRGSENFFIVRDDTSDRACAEAFAELAARDDVVRNPPGGDVARAHHDNSEDEQIKMYLYLQGTCSLQYRYLSHAD
jgi:hypothetical protein